MNRHPLISLLLLRFCLHRRLNAISRIDFFIKMKGCNQLIPNYLTRYYVAGENPFTSLNDLPLEDANAIKMMASDKYGWGGFYAQYDYLIHRREIEKWIYSELSKKGGHPQDDIPIYMFLGDCNGGFDKFGSDTTCLIIPIDALDLSSISFVWPDSMYEMLVNDKGELTGEGRRTNTPKVFMYHELIEVVERVNEFNSIKNRQVPFPASIEAQVWNRDMLESWYKTQIQ